MSGQAAVLLLVLLLSGGGGGWGGGRVDGGKGGFGLSEDSVRVSVCEEMVEGEKVEEKEKRRTIEAVRASHFLTNMSIALNA